MLLLPFKPAHPSVQLWYMERRGNHAHMHFSSDSSPTAFTDKRCIPADTRATWVTWPHIIVYYWLNHRSDIYTEHTMTHHDHIHTYIHTYIQTYIHIYDTCYYCYTNVCNTLPSSLSTTTVWYSSSSAVSFSSWAGVWSTSLVSSERIECNGFPWRRQAISTSTLHKQNKGLKRQLVTSYYYYYYYGILLSLTWNVIGSWMANSDNTFLLSCMLHWVDNKHTHTHTRWHSGCVG